VKAPAGVYLYLWLPSGTSIPVCADDCLDYIAENIGPEEDVVDVRASPVEDVVPAGHPFEGGKYATDDGQDGRIGRGAQMLLQLLPLDSPLLVELGLAAGIVLCVDEVGMFLARRGEMGRQVDAAFLGMGLQHIVSLLLEVGLQLIPADFFVETMQFLPHVLSIYA
jgi:hypothetical protein